MSNQTSSAAQIRSRVPGLAESTPAARTRLTVVPDRARRRSRVPFVTLICSVLLAGVVGLLLFNTSMQQASFAATDLEAQAASLDAREQELRVELDALNDPQRVALAARRMGMVEGSCAAFLHVSDGSVSGRPCAAGSTPGLPLQPPAPAKPKVLDPDPIRVPVSSRDGVGAAGSHDTRHTSH